MLGETWEAALSLRRGSVGNNVMYFETGQGQRTLGERPSRDRPTDTGSTGLCSCTSILTDVGQFGGGIHRAGVLAFTTNIAESNFSVHTAVQSPRTIPTEISAAVVQCRRYAGEILKILPRLSIDLRQRAKAANAAALVPILLSDLSVRFWIYGLDDCIGRVAIPGPA
jgi:hypothetical protein